MGSIIINSGVTALVLSIVLVLILKIGVKLLSKKQSSGASEQISELEKEINGITTSIQTLVDKYESLVSIDQLENLDTSKQELVKQLGEISSKLDGLDKALTAKQQDVDKAEAGHNDLKRAKEAAAILAEEIKLAKERLESENKALESELNQSLSQLEVLSQELQLNPEADAGMKKVKSALENSKTQLKTLTQMYQQSSTRFINLQSQYKDLEKEFTKLVENELSG